MDCYAGEFDSNYVADSLNEPKLDSDSEPINSVIQMEPIRRKPYVPLTAEECREKWRKYGPRHAGDVLERLSAAIKSKERVIVDGGRTLITTETIKRMSNSEQIHWFKNRGWDTPEAHDMWFACLLLVSSIKTQGTVNTDGVVRRPGAQRQTFILHGRPAPRLIAEFLMSKVPAIFCRFRCSFSFSVNCPGEFMAATYFL